MCVGVGESRVKAADRRALVTVGSCGGLTSPDDQTSMVCFGGTKLGAGITLKALLELLGFRRLDGSLKSRVDGNKG